MSLVIAPVSYKRLLTTISQQLQIEDPTRENCSNQAIMKDVFTITDRENLLIDHSYVSKKTNFLDILDEDTLLRLAYELGLDKKSELPELKDIEMSINYCAQTAPASSTWAGKNGPTETDAEKMIQR